MLRDPRCYCFNPRTPCGVRRKDNKTKVTEKKFQSTHSLRSATGLHYRGPTGATVSIHALLAECDLCPQLFGVWGRCFNPRTPCGVRQPYFGHGGNLLEVSIHALLAECDNIVLNCSHQREGFQSTHSLRSATGVSFSSSSSKSVSIHALLAECDRHLFYR